MNVKRYFFIALLVVVIIGSVIFWFNALNKKSASPFVINTSSQTVIKQLRSLNRLETALFTIEKVIDAGTQGNKFEEFLYGDRILLIAHGEVIAGFDLANLSEQNISIDGSTLKITLPKPQILVTKLDNDQTRVFDRKQGLLQRGDKDLESKARQAAEQEIKNAACKGNILSEASNNARKQLTTLFKTAGFNTVIVDIPPESC